jgi:4-hydroxy-tetrahydrodipicolinate synthase
MWQGSIVALVTPMQADGQLDWPRLQDLVEWQIAAGTTAIVSVGTTGESPTLNTQEHLEVIEKTLFYVNGRLPVIAGTGANATTEAQLLAKEAQALGAQAQLSVTPYYNKPTQEGLYRHYASIAEVSDLPLILYNVPGRTACDLQVATVARLAAAIPHLIGIKEAGGGVPRLAALRQETRPGFLLYSGDDDIACAAMCAGVADGVISVTANVAPEAMAQLCRLALAASAEEKAAAEALNATLALLHKYLFVEANPIPVKWALATLGRIDVGIRLPLTPLSSDKHELVKTALAAAGLLI